MKIKHYAMLLIALIMSSCESDIEFVGGVPNDFNVSVEKTTVKVNEEVNFKFEGNPGIISFYSGETLRDYAFKEGRIVPPGDIKLDFSTNVANGAQANQLSVMVSSDFNGVYDYENIKAATWTPVTDRFVYGTSSTFVASGSKSVSDLAVEGKPLYFLFKYIYDPAKTGTARTWGIRDFRVTSTTLLGTTVLLDQVKASFNIQSNPAKEVGRSYVTTTGTLTLYLRGNLTNSTANYLEDYAVSTPISVGSTDLGPDRPISVKGNSDARMSSYQHVYTKEGVYKVYFVATNANKNESKSVIRELEITVVK